MEDEQLIKISWSQIRTNEECRQKAYLHRQRKRSPGADKRNFFPGTVCDRVMRAWLDAPEQIPGAMPGMVEDILNFEEQEAVDTGDGVIRWRNSADKKIVLDWCKVAVQRLEPALRKLVLPYDYEPAKRFKTLVKLPYTHTDFRMVQLIGEMDILVRDENTDFHVWDLKATEDNSYWRKTLGQLVFYDIAVQCMFNKPAIRAGLIQPMCKDPVVYFKFSNDDYRQMWVRIHRFALDVWRENNGPKDDTKGCTRCDVYHACSKFPTKGHKALLGNSINLREEINDKGYGFSN